MERSLLWSVFAIGWVGWLCGLLLARAHRAESVREAGGMPRPYLMAALGLPVLVFLATLPTRPPLFAAGQGFGRGFLLGGLGALLAGASLMRACRSASAENRTARGAACAGLYALALVVATTPLLWMRHTLTDALPAAAIGWFVVSFVLALGLMNDAVTSSLRHPVLLALVSGTGFAATVCALALLGEYRGAVALTTEANAISWGALGLTFAAGVPFVLLLTALPTSFFTMLALKLPLSSLFARISGRMLQSEEARRSAARSWRLLFCLALMLGLGRLLALRVSGQPQLFRLIAIGLAVGLLAWWLTATQRRQEREDRDGAAAIGGQNGALAILVVLAGSMVAYQTLAGFGVGLLVTAAWLAGGLAVSAALEPADAAGAAGEDAAGRTLAAASQLTRLLLFGAGLLLYRVFVTRFENDLRGVALTDYYAVFGFLSGAVLPMLLSGFLLRPGLTQTTPGSQVLRLVVTGALALCVPTAILVLWGAKCALALFIGLALSLVVSAPPTPLPPGERGAPAAQSHPPAPATPGRTWERPGGRFGEESVTALCSLAVMLALTQWTHHVLALALLSRAEKIHILTWTVGVLFILILLADYGGRIAQWLRNRRQKPGAPLASEGAAQ